MSWRWWEQEGLDLEGGNDILAAESDGEEAQCGEGAVQEEMPVRERRQGVLNMGSSLILPLQYHYVVHSENNSYFFGIGPILDVELTCIFRPRFPLCT